MSLKAKIEAVIYASEEPVTLAQLVGLLGEEGQAELDTLRSQQTSLALDEESPSEPEVDDPEALNSEFLVPEPEADDEDDSLASPDSAAEAVVEPSEAVSESSEVVELSETVAEGSAPVVEAELSEPAEAEEAALVAEEAPIVEAEPVADTEPVGEAVVATAEVTVIAEDEKKLAREAAAQTKARERALRDYFRSLLEELIADFANGDRGLEVREVAGGYRLATKPEYHDAVRGFVKSLKPPLKLSLQALETLAVVAYKQPVTAPEVSEIRGVDSGGVLGGLMARKLVTTAGRKQVIGRPILYKTTKDFLVRFGLKDINELPSIEEFEKMAGELADADPVQEEIPMDEAHEHVAEEAEGVAEGGSTSVDEINSVPEPTTILHETPEDILSDKSVAPEGHEREHADPHEVEPMADVHEPQADGDSESTDEEDEEEQKNDAGE
jgi:segregation and condensation protein B